MESASPRRASQALGPARIETLADGVFAIAMTLLVLDLPCPLSNQSAYRAPSWTSYRDSSFTRSVSSCSASTGSLTTPNFG